MDFVLEKTKECIVCYGTPGWSSYFFAGLDIGYEINDDLWERCNKMIPESIKKTSRLNERVTWIEIYRLESSKTIGE